MKTITTPCESFIRAGQQDSNLKGREGGTGNVRRLWFLAEAFKNNVLGLTDG